MSGEAVKVIVRCRPLNERENRLLSKVIVGMDSSIVQVQLQKPKTIDAPPKTFTFDGVYHILDTTQQIYEDICFPLVSGVLEGYNGTVFAYGQTGCGKSYTMMGVEDPPANQGIIPRAFGHIFDHVAVNDSIKYLVRASYLEIYNEEVRDLLGKDAKRKLDLHEHPDKGVYVQGLSYHKVRNVQDLERVMNLGSNNRSVGATLMNVDSSRSHSIFSIELEMMAKDDGSNLRAGKLNLVDLAGSERQSKTGSTGDRLKEATKINLSLSALGNVISALVDGKSKHIPYRDSKLTRLLQSSLGGNTKTLMVACISPADNNYDETLSTLRYANRAKNIKNKPKINEDPKDALLREYQDEIEKLKMMLLGQMDVPKDIKTRGSAAVESLSPKQSASTVPSQPSEEQLKSWELEKEAIKKDYETRLAKLQGEFGEEQASKEQLKLELNKLQEERDQQLTVAETKLHNSAVTETPEEYPPEPNAPEAPPTTTPNSTQSSWEVEGVSSLEAVSNLADKDKTILMEHEMALQRLEQLQNELIGGEKAADEELKKHLAERQQAAEERQLQLTKTTSLFDEDDDNVLERIFNSLTDEVRVKTKVIERSKAKLESAEEDIKDLYAEFELDREDYLSTIREQDRRIKLYEQLLATVVPCLRRDCNYFNIDKVKVECTWNSDSGQWEIPKLTINKTVLSPAALPKGVAERRGKGTTPAHSSNKPNSSSSSDINVRESSNSLLRGGHTYENLDEDRYMSRLQQKSDESVEYFKPKRALELIGHSGHSSHLGKESRSPLHNHAMDTPPSLLRGSGSLSSLPLSSLPNAAAVHGIDPLLNDTCYGRRPGKLQSLARNPPIPPTLTARNEPADILEKMEKKLATRKNLEPLADIKTKRKSH